MDSNKYLTSEKHLILRIIEQWGNAATMGEMEQWLKDYAAKAYPHHLTPGAPTTTGTYFAVLRPYAGERDEMVVLHYRADKGVYYAYGVMSRPVKAEDIIGHVAREGHGMAEDWARDYDTLYYIVMPVLNKLRHRTDNDTRMIEMGSDIRDTIHKALSDIKKLRQPISSNEPPFLVQSATPAAVIRQDAHEKEIMMQAFEKVRQIFEGRQWVMDGRGSYPYNDDRYKEEIRYMYNEFDEVVKDTWANIQSKSVDYRKAIIAEYLATPAAGREDAVVFAEWAIRNATVTSAYDGWIYDSKRYTTAELYELFKQQKESK